MTWLPTVALVAALAAAGCSAGPPTYTAAEKHELVKGEIHLGMQRDQLLELMGQPDRILDHAACRAEEMDDGTIIMAMPMPPGPDDPNVRYQWDDAPDLRVTLDGRDRVIRIDVAHR